MTEADPVLIARFDAEMEETYWLVGRATGYWAGYFLREVRAKGGLPTARRLLAAPGVSDGFLRLVKEHRLDFSMEAIVLQPMFRPLFTQEELDCARARLKKYGFDAAESLAQPEPLGDPIARAKLASLLDQVEAEPKQDRIYRKNEVAEFGIEARWAMERWLADEHLAVFALGVLERLAPEDDRALGAIEQYAARGGSEHELARAALERLRRPQAAALIARTPVDVYMSDGHPEASFEGCGVQVQGRPCSNPGRHPIDGTMMCTTHRKAWERKRQR